MEIFHFDDDLIVPTKDRFKNLNTTITYVPNYKQLNDLDKYSDCDIKMKINYLNYYYYKEEYTKCLSMCHSILANHQDYDAYDTLEKPTDYKPVSKGNNKTIVDIAIRCALQLKSIDELKKLLCNEFNEYDFGLWYTKILALQFLKDDRLLQDCLLYLSKRKYDERVMAIVYTLPIDMAIKESIKKNGYLQ